MYAFLSDTYATEIDKVLTAWAHFEDADMDVRPHPDDARGRNLLEHMIHQCLSENLWFERFFGIQASHAPLPEVETRLAFIEHYHRCARERLAALRAKEGRWWETEVSFFGPERSRAWIMTRRIAHTAHHRGQQLGLLRQLGRDLYSTYGPTADTGGLMQHEAPTIYPYPDAETLVQEEAAERRKQRLPGLPRVPVTERGERIH